MLQRPIADVGSPIGAAACVEPAARAAVGAPTLGGRADTGPATPLDVANGGSEAEGCGASLPAGASAAALVR
jgi:hypothetical protein